MAFTTRPELRGTFGAVSSTHWLASQAGMSLLEGGRNAFDAAVAAGLVLQVVEPHLNGPAGEVPIILNPAGSQEPIVISGQGPSPAAANIQRFRDLGLDLVPGTGLLPACVPGAFGAWMTLLRDHGSATLAEVLEPAIHYAGEGYPLVPRIAETIGTMRDLFETHWKSSFEIYFPNGDAPQAGRLFRNPALADTYRAILEEGQTASGREAQIDRALGYWYRGPVAETIDRFCRETDVYDITERHNRGLLTADDLASWTPQVERPLFVDHGDYRVFKCGPWSQGPMLLQMLKMLGHDDLAALDPTGPDFVHLVTETIKLAMADRDCWFGDSGDVPMDDLLSDAYAAERRGQIGDAASMDFRPGSPGGRAPALPPLRPVGTIPQPGAGFGEPTVARQPAPPVDRAGEAALAGSGLHRGDTCHVDVVDRWGNMIAATPSGGWFQSSPAIPGLGFALGVRGQMFWLEEGLNSSLKPGVRPRTTLTPSFAYRGGKPYLAFGTPGGDQQDQWQLIMFLRHVHHGMNLQEAIDAPSWHTDHLVASFWPREIAHGSVTLEARFPAATVDELRRRGHSLTLGEDWSEGRLCAAAREADGDRHLIKAAANPRGMQGYAVAR